ncbi:hypothetical protein Tco_0040733 [Tanacetum coccineum]
MSAKSFLRVWHSPRPPSSCTIFHHDNEQSPIDAIGKGGHDKIFNEFCSSLKSWKYRFFLIDRRAIRDAIPLRHHNSSVSDPPPTSVRAEDNHVGHHPAFKDGKGNVVASMSHFLKFPMASGVRIGRAQEAKDRAASKRPTPRGPSCWTKKKKTAPMSVGLSESNSDGSPQSGSGTVHSASPLNTVIPGNIYVKSGGSNQALQSSTHVEEETDNVSNNNNDDDNEVNSPHSASPPHSEQSPHSKHYLHSKHSLHSEDHENVPSGGDGIHLTEGSGNIHHVATGSAGSSSHTFPSRNSGGDGGSFQAHVSPPVPFVLSWNLTTGSNLNDVEFCYDMMINLATPFVRAQQNRLSDHQALQQAWFELGRETLAHSCKDLSQRLTDTQNNLVGVLRTRAILSKDHKTLQQVHLDCAGREPFNQAIVVGWSEGVKVDQTEEEAQAILATADNYDPGYQATFMSAFGELFTESYPY